MNIIYGCLISFLTGFLICTIFVRIKGHEWHDVIVKHEGCAEYNRYTGKFQWIGEENGD